MENTTDTYQRLLNAAADAGDHALGIFNALAIKAGLVWICKNQKCLAPQAESSEVCTVCGWTRAGYWLDGESDAALETFVDDIDEAIQNVQTTDPSMLYIQSFTVAVCGLPVVAFQWNAEDGAFLISEWLNQ